VALQFKNGRFNAMFPADFNHSVRTTAPCLDSTGSVKRLSNQGISQDRFVGAAEQFRSDTGEQIAIAADLDPIIKDCDGDITAGIGIIAMHDCVEDHFSECVGWDGQTVFPLDTACDEVPGERQGAVKKRHGFAHDCEGMQELLLVIEDVTSDLRASKTAHLHTNLRIIREKPQTVKDLSGLGDLAVMPQTQPVENIAHVAAGACGDSAKSDCILPRAKDFFMIEIVQCDADCGLVFPASSRVLSLHQQPLILVLRHARGGCAGSLPCTTVVSVRSTIGATGDFEQND